MRLLDRTSSFFREWFTTEEGLRFRGTLAPLTDGNAQTSTYLEPRMVFLTRPGEPVTAGTVISDEAGERFLLANHDKTPHRKTFRVFKVNDHLAWTRPSKTIEPVTGLERSDTENDMGLIWCSAELYGREEVDRGLKIGQDRQRLITGAALELNDKVKGLSVRRITLVYGVTIAEIM